MILHTTVPYELMFPLPTNEYYKQKLVTIQGIPMIVEKEQERYRIVRILSSNPFHYMMEQYTPGQYISLN
jgi:hypothetical protein